MSGQNIVERINKFYDNVAKATGHKRSFVKMAALRIAYSSDKMTLNEFEETVIEYLKKVPVKGLS